MGFPWLSHSFELLNIVRLETQPPVYFWQDVLLFTLFLLFVSAGEIQVSGYAFTFQKLTQNNSKTRGELNSFSFGPLKPVINLEELFGVTTKKKQCIQPKQNNIPFTVQNFKDPCIFTVIPDGMFLPDPRRTCDEVA